MVDNLITLHEYNVTSFNNLGIGVLTDVISCNVANEVNGKYELTMEYPMNGAHFDDILNRRILYCSTSPFDDAKQAFRIYSMSKPIKGIVSIKALHISYDLSDLYVLPFTLERDTSDPLTVTDILDEIIDSCKSLTGLTTLPFTFSVDDPYQTTWNASTNTPTLSNTPSAADKGKYWRVSTAGTFQSVEYDVGDSIVAVYEDGVGSWRREKPVLKFEVTSPTSVKSVLGNGDNTILGMFKGEFKFNNYSVTWHKNGFGTDNGVVIRYGKNLTDLKQEENCSKVCTHILPYYKSGDSYIYIENDTEPKNLLSISGASTDVLKILPVDLTSKFESEPSQDDLFKEAQNYVQEQGLPNPEVSLTISFVQLTNAKEYQTLAMVENINLGDTITVMFPRLNVNTKAEAISYQYNVITKKYVSMEIGELKSTIYSVIAGVKTSVDNVFSNIHKSTIGQSIDSTIKVANGVSVDSTVKIWNNEVTENTESDHKIDAPNEIVISDDPEIQNSDANVWVWNASGLAFSSTGYNGSNYKYGFTSDGKINASMIKVGTIDASVIGARSITATQLNVTTAGSNMVKNSVGLNADEPTNPNYALYEWTEYMDGNIGTPAKGYKELPVEARFPDLVNACISKSYIGVSKVTDGTYIGIKQKIGVVKGETYALSFKSASSALTTAASGQKYGQLIISDDAGINSYTIDITGNKYNWTENGYIIVPQSSTIIIKLISTQTNYYTFFTDIMLSKGNIPSEWLQAENETYTENVIIDSSGVTVRRKTTETHTNINHEEFAVWYGDQKRITVNSDNTQLKKTTIEDSINFKMTGNNQQDHCTFVATDTGLDILVY